MLETQRLILREMREDDMDSFLGIFTDPVAMSYFGVVFDREQMKQWVQRNLQHQKEHGFSLYTVILKGGNEIIGDCGLETDIIEGQLTIGLGYDFNRKYWHKGYATEAATAVLDYGFASFDFDRIAGWANPENKPSIRVAERLGFTREKSVTRDNKPYVLLSITRQAWAKHKGEP